MAQLVKNPPAMWETWVRALHWEDPPGKGNSYPLQYCGLENSMDCTVLGVAKSRTRLSDFYLLSGSWGYLWGECNIPLLPGVLPGDLAHRVCVTHLDACARDPSWNEGRCGHCIAAGQWAAEPPSWGGREEVGVETPDEPSL